MQAAEPVAQILELRRVGREQAAEHNLLRRLEAGKGGESAFLSSVMVSPTCVSATCLIWAVRSRLRRAPNLDIDFLGRETPTMLTTLYGVVLHRANLSDACAAHVR